MQDMGDDQLRYLVKPADNYIFLRDILKKQMGISQSLLAKLKAQHKIRVNGQNTLTNYRLKVGDRKSVV